MSEPFIGEIKLFGFNFNPRGWAFCAGALLPISTNSTLFSLLGTIYGGDGRTTFGLPDLRGRVAMNQGRHPGSLYSWRMGQRGGAETHTLTLPELARHAHAASFTSSGSGSSPSVTLFATTDLGDNAEPSADAFLAQTNPPNPGPDKAEKIYKTNPAEDTLVSLGGVTVEGGSGSGGIVTVDPNGASKAFSIIQPVLTLNYCIAMVGLYPPRS